MKKIIIGFLVFVFGLLAVYAAINFKDEPLDVAVAEILNRKYEYSPEQIAGYKYLLGITAPIGTSVEEQGEKRYQNITAHLQGNKVSLYDKTNYHQIDPPELPIEICEGTTCTKEQIVAHPKEIALYLSGIRMYLDRLDKLLSFNGIVNTIQPAMINSPPTFAVFTLMRLKIIELQYKAYVEKNKSVIPELERMQNHFVNNLSHPDSLISAVIDTAILTGIREFYSELIKEPAYKTAKIPAPKLDIENIVKGTIYYELNAFKDALGWDVKYVLFPSTIDGHLSKETPWYQSLFVQNNRTLNTHHRELLKSITTRCETKDVCGSSELYEPKWYEYVQNPVGKMYVRLFAQTDKSYAKMIFNLENINQDVSAASN